MKTWGGMLGLWQPYVVLPFFTLSALMGHLVLLLFSKVLTWKLPVYPLHQNIPIKTRLLDMVLFWAWVVILDWGSRICLDIQETLFDVLVTAVASSYHLFYYFEVGHAETQGQGLLQTTKCKPRDMQVKGMCSTSLSMSCKKHVGWNVWELFLLVHILLCVILLTMNLWWRTI